MSMKRLRFVTALLVTGGLLFGVSQQATTNSSGAPTNNAAGNGYASAPAENGRTCATSGCHNGPATAKDDMITVQGLPAGGYTPGETYVVEVGTSESSTRWGFQASVQTPTGDIAGSVATRDGETRLTQVAGYITHTTSGTSGNNSKSWTFDWTAPAAGTGDVGVYVAINASNANGTTSGDNILYDELIIPEGQPTGIAPALTTWDVQSLQLQQQTLTLSLHGHSATGMQIEVFAVNGQRVMAEEISALQGQTQISLALPQAAGMYLVRLTSGDQQQVHKVVGW